MCNKLERTTIALVTTMTASVDGSRYATCRHGQRQSYTVKLWRLANKGNTITMNGRTWYWCLGDHYSGGKKYNGMYCLHDTTGHDTWRRDQDKNQAKQCDASRTGRNVSDVG